MKATWWKQQIASCCFSVWDSLQSFQRFSRTSTAQSKPSPSLAWITAAVLSLRSCFHWCDLPTSMTSLKYRYYGIVALHKTVPGPVGLTGQNPSLRWGMYIYSGHRMHSGSTTHSWTQWKMKTWGPLLRNHSEVRHDGKSIKSTMGFLSTRPLWWHRQLTRSRPDVTRRSPCLRLRNAWATADPDMPGLCSATHPLGQGRLLTRPCWEKAHFL